MKSHINSILIPTDFSDSSENALGVGIAIAKRQNASITLLHVVDRYVYLQPHEVFIPEIKIMPDINYMIEFRLKEFSESLAKITGLDIKGKVLNGQPFEQICQLSFNEKTDLIVMGTHGTSGSRGLFMGSEAYRVVKNASCPVLTIPGNWKNKGFKKVLFPIRLIPGALEKYFYARPIIEKNHSEIFILGLTDLKNTHSTKDLISLIEKLKNQLKNDNIKFQTSYCPDDDFPKEVSKTAKLLEVDLIILTANIDPDWKSYIIGPFVKQVINHAQVPVLSIKPANRQNEEPLSAKLIGKWGRSAKISVKKKGTDK